MNARIVAASLLSGGDGAEDVSQDRLAPDAGSHAGPGDAPGMRLCTGPPPAIREGWCQ